MPGVSSAAGEATGGAAAGRPPHGIACLAKAVRARDRLTAGRVVSDHEERVASLSSLLADRLGMRSGFVETIGLVAGVHDIGKLAVPDSILLKPSPLTGEEWAVLRSHTTIGHLILSGQGEPLLDVAASVARSHHEAFDGGGYPDGLRGEAIPLEARIVAVCDVYDALRQTRPYKRGLGHAAAMELLKEGDARLSPSIFDPSILVAFLGMAPRVERAWEERAP